MSIRAYSFCIHLLPIDSWSSCQYNSKNLGFFSGSGQVTSQNEKILWVWPILGHARGQNGGQRCQQVTIYPTNNVQNAWMSTNTLSHKDLDVGIHVWPISFFVPFWGTLEVKMGSKRSKNALTYKCPHMCYLTQGILSLYRFGSIHFWQIYNLPILENPMD